ncbi:MAG TPA: hypothetical protein VEM59_01125 [Acidimicrobiia bacterium]|nr:hypothetical protein [Acidimicrobiia bacterium]
MVLATAATAVACSGGSSGNDEAAGKLPLNKKAVIEKVFESPLDRLGLRLTRGALVDLKTGKPSAKGTHLAVYVEPTGPYTADDYARRVVAVTRVFAPRSFDMWRGLQSFDVCQEPLPEVDARPEPPPKTKVTMTRDAARKLRWKGLDLSTLLTDAKRLGSRQLSVYAASDVRSTARYQDAMVRAQASQTTSPPPPAPSY